MILITGASGFIGAHLLSSIIEIYGQEKILALTSKPTSKCKYLLHNDFIFDDDYFVNSGFDNIDTVLHLGAFTPKSNAASNEVKECNSNIISTARLLTSNFPKLKKFIFFSTLDVYAYDNPITEITLLSPSSLYGHSKVYCEQMISAWAAQKNICHQILRIGHVYGEGEEKYNKIIPITMQRLLSNTPLQMYGDGAEIRSFIYIQDVVNAVINVLKIKKHAGVINLVGEKKISIKELVNEIVTISGMNLKIDLIEKTTPTRDLVFDNSRMKELLAIPKVGLKEGLIKEWHYMKNLSK
jgi:nucleoside-diphosphate-sugar epimerase